MVGPLTVVVSDSGFQVACPVQLQDGRIMACLFDPTEEYPPAMLPGTPIWVSQVSAFNVHTVHALSPNQLHWRELEMASMVAGPA